MRQAYLFAAARTQLPAGLGIALPPISSVRTGPKQAGFASLLTRLKVRNPPPKSFGSADDFAASGPYPVFRPRPPFGTRAPASAGRRRTPARCAASFNSKPLTRSLTLAVQAAVTGRARAHASGIRSRTSRRQPHLSSGVEGRAAAARTEDQRRQRRGSHTGRADRTGAQVARPLSFDTSWMTQPIRPHFIDANPRLVEPMNAWLSGVDLTRRLVAYFAR